MASNSEEVPPDMDKFLFAEDLISHFMNKLVYKNFPFSSVNIAPRSERYRKYVYCGFDEIVRKAVDILYKSLRRKAHQEFIEIARHDAVKFNRFIEYEIRLRERYFSDGVDAENFLKYCVMLAVMTKHFFMCNCVEMPDRAFDFILNRFPLGAMGEVTWGFLRRTARRIVRDHEKVRESSSSSSDSDPTPDSNPQINSGCDCFRDKIEGTDFLFTYRIRNYVIERHQSKCVSKIFRQERLFPELSPSKEYASTSRKMSKYPDSENYPEVQLPYVSFIDVKLAGLTADEFKFYNDKTLALELYNEYGKSLFAAQFEKSDSRRPPRLAKCKSAIGDNQRSTSQSPDASYQKLVESYFDDNSQLSTSQHLEASIDCLPQFLKDEMLTNQQNNPHELSPNRQRTSEPATSDLEEHNSEELTTFLRKFKSFSASEANLWAHAANQAENNADLEYKLPDIDYEYLFAASSGTKTTFKSECSKTPSEVGSGSHSAETGNGQPNKNNVPISDDIGIASSFTTHVPCNQEICKVPISDDSGKASTPTAQVTSNQEVSVAKELT